MAGDEHGRSATDIGTNELSAPTDALTDVFREEAGRITAALVGYLGDFAIAEEAVYRTPLFRRSSTGPSTVCPSGPAPGCSLWHGERP